MGMFMRPEYTETWSTNSRSDNFQLTHKSSIMEEGFIHVPYLVGTPSGPYPGASDVAKETIGFTAGEPMRLQLKWKNLQDVRNIGLKQLRSLIGFVPQKSVLLSGTIRSNLEAVKPGATENDIFNALEIAQAKEFVVGKEEGIDAPVSQGGTNFSGGQRQRLAIARAIIKMAPIYIFDDSFSALDFTTDLNLRKALKQNLEESTIIIVGQRVASIMDADQIIVMDDGKISAIGNHEYLMENSDIYREVYDSQNKQGGEADE